MEHTEQVFQYIQAHPQSRAGMIVKGVAIPRRKVFKSLALLVRSGRVNKEGWHPKIFYTTKAAPAVETPLSNPAQALSSNNSSELERLRVGMKEAKEEIFRIHRELSRSHEELNRRMIDLKSYEAKAIHNDHVAQQSQENLKRAQDENKRLLEKSKFLEEALRESQNQAAKARMGLK